MEIVIAVILITGFLTFHGYFIYVAIIETCERGVKIDHVEPLNFA